MPRITHLFSPRRCAALLYPLILSGTAGSAAQPRTVRATPGSFTVMSFNIRHGDARDGRHHWLRRREAAAAVIRTEAPDVVGLQEALPRQLDYLLSAIDGYTVIGRGRQEDGGGEQAAIMVRHSRFRIDTAATFWFSDSPHVAGSTHWGNRLPRTCTWARLVDRLTGDSLLCLNVHLDHRSRPSRTRSARLLIERARQHAQGLPVVVTGDFNAGERSRCVRVMTGGLDGDSTNVWTPLVDTYRALYPATRFTGTHHWFRGFRLGPKIDYIFTSSSARILDARILRSRYEGRFPSDHFPIVTELAIQ
jgi:endonuclease/exonuclease/phosphatase family metal-dependent hydrolase